MKPGKEYISRNHKVKPGTGEQLKKVTRVCDCCTMFLMLAYIFVEDFVKLVIPLIAIIFTILYGCASYFNWKAPKKDKVHATAIVLGHPYSGFMFFLTIDIAMIIHFCVTGHFVF